MSRIEMNRRQTEWALCNLSQSINTLIVMATDSTLTNSLIDLEGAVLDTLKTLRDDRRIGVPYARTLWGQYLDVLASLSIEPTSSQDHIDAQYEAAVTNADC